MIDDERTAVKFFLTDDVGNRFVVETSLDQPGEVLEVGRVEWLLQIEIQGGAVQSKQVSQQHLGIEGGAVDAARSQV